jgi:Alr-MurF fusion protein
MIVIKGGRRFEFEQIVGLLEQEIHGTKLEISLNALSHNLNLYRSLLNLRTKIMVMTKAFAYGSGNFEVAHLLQYQKVDYLAVAYTDEGVSLRQNGIYLPIMVMNPTVESFELISRYRLEPEIYSLRLLKEYVGFVKDEIKNREELMSKHSSEARKKFAIHLKLDTGMNRLGVVESQLAEVASLLREHRNDIEVKSIFSHLAASDEAQHDDFSLAQIAHFQRLAGEMEQQIGYRTLKHLLNTAGIGRFPQAQFDMVRLGIGLYGVDSAKKHQDQLQTVCTLKTTISQIKSVAPPQTVGYSRKGEVSQPTRIATLAIGYADGYLRVFGNGVGKVKLNGKYAPIIGNICMDMCMIDLSNHPEAKEGDEVIVFGQDPTVSQLAESTNTIPYEILTNIGERVRRIYYAD